MIADGLAAVPTAGATTSRDIAELLADALLSPSSPAAAR
jgi:hypothetical protein